MSFAQKVVDILRAETTRSPSPIKPTTDMFIEKWAKGKYVICFEQTVDCPQDEIEEVHRTFYCIQLMMLANLHCVGWQPQNFHRICNMVNLILKGRALVSVGQKWAFDDDDHWTAAQRCVETNIRHAVQDSIFA